MSDDKGKPTGVSEILERSFNGVSNLRPLYIESTGPGVGLNLNNNNDQSSQSAQNTSSETGG